ncbi:hypothetical protein [Streptomyces fructofermentans]|uniref:hypothetical protein n=1 Tax=Streptomyces fructofermentans TaxID=152141 RepID=UPI0037A53359
MRRQVVRDSMSGRRGALGGAAATVVCLGMVLVACGAGGGGPGRVAVQRPPAPGGAVAPTGEVELTPLDGPSAADGPAGEGSSRGPAAPDTGGGPSASGADAGPDRDGARTAPARGGDSVRPSGSSAPGGPSGAPSATTAPRPAALSAGTPEREPADRRWCEKVTVGFRNTGGTAVRSGTVTFGTHIIGALGTDWATVESTEELPVPIAAGGHTERTWTVCVDAWRVPLGMHVETRDVSVRWE